MGSIGGVFDGSVEPDDPTMRYFSALADAPDQDRDALAALVRRPKALLLDELSHRVKNTLATVQSLAAQSLRGVQDANEGYKRLEGRILGLSAAHNILTERNWEGAALVDLVRRTVAPFVVGDETRLQCAGPEIWVRPQEAVALSLALHELATNAAKYGALSGEAGRVTLAWSENPTDAGPHLHLEWRESGGPPVTKPAHRGFGSRLLAQGLRADLDGEAELAFAPTGVVCRISAPLEPPPQLDLG
mgnify:CR=1 FL=1